MDIQPEATSEPTASLAKESPVMEPEVKQDISPETENASDTKETTGPQKEPEQTTNQSNSTGANSVADSGRRRSTRARRAPASYVPETIVLRPQRVSQKETRQRKKLVAAKAAAKLAKASGAKPVSKKQPQYMAKVRYCSIETLPNFEAIELSPENTELFWLKVAMREFFLRFDKLCRLPIRHAATISDPLAEWNDYVFKAAILSLFRIILNDSQPICAQAKTYLAAIEHTQAESAELWTVLAEFLAEADNRPESARKTVKKEQELAGEHGRLAMLRRLQVLASSSETIRLTVTGDQEELVSLQKDNNEEIAKQRKAFSETETKLAKLKAHDEDLYFHRYENAKRAADGRIFKLEQTMYQQLRKYNLRTAPLGTDNFGNKYWGLQHRAKSDETWGSYVVCEMKRVPKEDDAKKLIEYVDQLLARAPKRKREVKNATDAKPKAEPKKGKKKIEPTPEKPGIELKEELKTEKEESKLEPEVAAEDAPPAPPQIPQVDGLSEDAMEIDSENMDVAKPEPVPEQAVPTEPVLEQAEPTEPVSEQAEPVSKSAEPSASVSEPAENLLAEPAEPETAKPAIKKLKISVKEPKQPKAVKPKQPKQPKEPKPELTDAAPKKPRQRKPKAPVFDQQGGLFKVSGADELKRLAKWIESQPGPKQTALFTEIENMATYLY